jgi:SAM-dependent methyltransferase
MFGSEQALIEGSSFQRRIATRLFGVIHMGVRLRFWSNVAASKGLLERGELHILEVGSENGALAFWLARKYPWHQVAGMEIHDDKVQQSNKLRDQLELENVEFVQGDAAEPFTFLNKFNLIFSTHVLEHIEEDSGALRNMYDALDGGGTLILQVPRKVSEALTERDIAGGHHRRYTEGELQRKMEEAGFQGVEVKRCRGKLGDYAYGIDSKLASLKGPLPMNVALFPLLLLLGYIDHLTTKEPEHGGLIAIGKRG